MWKEFKNGLRVREEWDEIVYKGQVRREKKGDFRCMYIVRVFNLEWVFEGESEENFGRQWFQYKLRGNEINF